MAKVSSLDELTLLCRSWVFRIVARPRSFRVVIVVAPFRLSMWVSDELAESSRKYSRSGSRIQNRACSPKHIRNRSQRAACACSPDEAGATLDLAPFSADCHIVSRHPVSILSIKGGSSRLTSLCAKTSCCFRALLPPQLEMSHLR